MKYSDFISWEILATFGGATAMTGFATQFLKNLFDKTSIKIKTQLLSYMVALTILLLTAIFDGATFPSHYVLCIFNAMIVSTSSNGAFEIIKTLACKSSDDTKKGDDDEDNS